MITISFEKVSVCICVAKSFTATVDHNARTVSSFALDTTGSEIRGYFKSDLVRLMIHNYMIHNCSFASEENLTNCSQEFF